MQIDTQAAMAVTDPVQWRALLAIAASWLLLTGTAAAAVLAAVRWAR
jgi:hypothetical protein